MQAALARYGTPGGDTIVERLGGRGVACSVSPLTLRFAYRTERWMRNPAGTTHGGIIATMLDNAMGMSAHIVSPYGGAAPTAELQVSYLKPVPPEAEVHILVRVEHVSGRMVRMRAELRLTDRPETLCATASAINCPIRG